MTIRNHYIVFEDSKVSPNWTDVIVCEGHYAHILPYKVHWSAVCSHGYFMASSLEGILKYQDEITCNTCKQVVRELAARKRQQAIVDLNFADIVDKLE